MHLRPSDFEHLPGTDRVLMYHIPTRTTFEIVYDPDQAMLGGLTIFGFAARLVDTGSARHSPTMLMNWPPSATPPSPLFSTTSAFLAAGSSPSQRSQRRVITPSEFPFPQDQCAIREPFLSSSSAPSARPRQSSIKFFQKWFFVVILDTEFRLWNLIIIEP
jgi:hypothetical protein